MGNCVRRLLRIATIVAEMLRIKASSDYTTLTDSIRAELERISDAKQFLASSVAGDAQNYGKDSSQAVEVDNKAIKPGQYFDPVRAVL